MSFRQLLLCLPLLCCLPSFCLGDDSPPYWYQSVSVEAVWPGGGEYPLYYEMDFGATCEFDFIQKEVPIGSSAGVRAHVEVWEESLGFWVIDHTATDIADVSGLDKVKITAKDQFYGETTAKHRIRVQCWVDDPWDEKDRAYVLDRTYGQFKFYDSSGDGGYGDDDDEGGY